MTRAERCSNCGGTEFVDAVDNDGQRYRGCARCRAGAGPSVIALPGGDLFVAVHLESLERALAHRGLAIVAVTPQAAEHRRVRTAAEQSPPEERCASCGQRLDAESDRDAYHAALLRRAQSAIPPGPFSLRKLVGAQKRIEQVACDFDGYVCPFSAEQLAMFSYALGIPTAERLAAGERLDDPEVPA